MKQLYYDLEDVKKESEKLIEKVDRQTQLLKKMHPVENVVADCDRMVELRHRIQYLSDQLITTDIAKINSGTQIDMGTASGLRSQEGDEHAFGGQKKVAKGLLPRSLQDLNSGRHLQAH